MSHTYDSIAKPQYATSSGVRMVLILAWIENAHDERAISCIFNVNSQGTLQ